jgi:hypothetical protein
MNRNKREGSEFPAWLRYTLICIAIIYLIWVIFFKSGVQREDFPLFRRF